MVVVVVAVVVLAQVACSCASALFGLTSRDGRARRPVEPDSGVLFVVLLVSCDPLRAGPGDTAGPGCPSCCSSVSALHAVEDRAGPRTPLCTAFHLPSSDR